MREVTKVIEFGEINRDGSYDVPGYDHETWGKKVERRKTSMNETFLKKVIGEMNKMR